MSIPTHAVGIFVYKEVRYVSVMISSVEHGSKAYKKGLKKGDLLLKINSNEIQDVLDYRFYIMNKKLSLEIMRDGKTFEVKIKKDEFADIGLEFETYLMDEQRHCKNKCVFCFIDQLPNGLRSSLYFKDDDSRMSFLFGNYITLTNITEHEVERIIKMHISPINISVHTTNPELRVKMMKNKNAGQSLDIMYKLAQAGTKLNCQIVLCPGLNDGDELRRSLADLTELCPAVQSVAVVPIGITKYRDGLDKLSGFDANSAAQTIDLIDEFGDICEKKFGDRIVYASDEFYLKSKRPLPEREFYGDFAQLENGVGMCTLMKSEFFAAVESEEQSEINRHVTIATGTGFEPVMNEMVDTAKQKWHNLKCNVIGVKNDFFGHDINVSGLIVGQDLINQLKGKALGDELLLPASMFRSESDIMLDDTSVEDIERELGVKVRICQNDGYELLNSILGE